MDSRDVFGGALPPGCRQADLEHGVSRLDDCSPGQLWRLLDERQKALLLGQFIHDEWAELAGWLDDEARNSGQSLRSIWIGWRDRAVLRMALDGRIRGRR